jgi:hypothetical protein
LSVEVPPGTRFCVHSPWYRDRALWQALTLGLVLRLLAALLGYGPLALDDYGHVLVPARNAALGLTPEIPGYRSLFPVGYVAGLFSIGRWLGLAADPVLQVQWVGVAAGLVSLLTVPAAYFYGHLKGNVRLARVAAFVLAVHFALPFIETRVFGESLSIPYVFLGVVVAETAIGRRSLKLAALGGALLAVSCLFRFQNLLFVAAYGALLFAGRERALGAALTGVALGLFAIGQIAVDALGGRAAFATFVAYFQETVGSKSIGETQSPFVFVALLAGLFLLPLSAPLFLGAGRAWREHRRPLTAALVFLAVHSIVAHKEERFLIPAVPLFLLGLAAAWEACLDRPFIRKILTPVLVGLGAVLAVAVSSNNSQSGFFGPLVAFQRAFDKGLCLEIDGPHLASIGWIREYFVWKPVAFAEVASSGLTADALREELEKRSLPAALVTGDSIEAKAALEKLVGNAGIGCGPVEQSSPWIDRAIYRMNPVRNVRRRPRFFRVCRLAG